jgi:RNA polymerase sigma-70 factor, ECF subfamily
MPENSEPEPQPDGGQFAAHYAACERQLFGFVYSVHPYADDVEDILQETLAVLWQKFASYDPSRPFFNWACSFAFLKVKEHRRREARRRRIFNEETLEALKQASERIESDQPQREAALASCLKKLPETDRDLVVQRYDSGESLKTIAEVAGITANTLYKRLQRIRFVLAECVEKRLALETE